MPRLPPELVQRVEDFCSSSDILSFVLVDKSSYRYAIGMLYKCVMLTSKTQIARFSDTMCSNRPCMDLPALRTLPIILYISLPDEATVQPSPEIDHTIMNILHATINILDLILFLPSYDVDRLYQQPGFGPFAFKLIRFTCRTLKPPGFYDFLRQQDEIENLTIHCPGELLETGPVDLHYPASDLLPRLGYLTAGPRSVHQLVPGRPVYAIRILAPLHFSQIEPTISVIAQASVPLLLFDVAIAFNDESECNNYCTEWLSSLSRFRKTLRIIDFLIVPTPDFVVRTLRTAGHPICITIEPDDFLVLLRAFDALRMFVLSCECFNQPWTFKLGVPGLSEFKSWQRICPTLSLVSIFGSALPEQAMHVHKV